MRGRGDGETRGRGEAGTGRHGTRGRGSTEQRLPISASPCLRVPRPRVSPSPSPRPRVPVSPRLPVSRLRVSRSLPNLPAFPRVQLVGKIRPHTRYSK